MVTAHSATELRALVLHCTGVLCSSTLNSSLAFHLPLWLLLFCCCLRMWLCCCMRLLAVQLRIKCTLLLLLRLQELLRKWLLHPRPRLLHIAILHVMLLLCRRCLLCLQLCCRLLLLLQLQPILLLIQQLHLFQVLLHLWIEQELLLLLLLEELRTQLCLLQLHLLLSADALHRKAASQHAGLLLLLLQVLLLLERQLLQLQLLQLVGEHVVWVGCGLQPLSYCLCCCVCARIGPALE